MLTGRMRLLRRRTTTTLSLIAVVAVDLPALVVHGLGRYALSIRFLTFYGGYPSSVSGWIGRRMARRTESALDERHFHSEPPLRIGILVLILKYR
jgi:hypothetical protein